MSEQKIYYHLYGYYTIISRECQYAKYGIFENRSLEKTRFKPFGKARLLLLRNDSVSVSCYFKFLVRGQDKSLYLCAVGGDVSVLPAEVVL